VESTRRPAAARPGRFLAAQCGTLCLDEIGDMPLAAQTKLLRALQEKSIEPVGADDSVPVDVRVIVASHVDLEEAVANGHLREDLYYRLAVFPIARALERSGGKIYGKDGAAALLGVRPTTLQSKVRRFGLA
jgi:transcriptional regulator with GAF, ATPase, and Fis domain